MHVLPVGCSVRLFGQDDDKIQQHYIKKVCTTQGCRRRSSLSLPGWTIIPNGTNYICRIGKTLIQKKTPV